MSLQQPNVFNKSIQGDEIVKSQSNNTPVKKAKTIAEKNRGKSFIVDAKLEKNSKQIFTGQFEDFVLLEHEIQRQIKDIGKDIILTKKQSEAIVKESKKTFIQNRKSTSLQTILSIANTMVGSAVLVLPYNFLKGGFALSLIVMSIMFIVNYYTCRRIVQIQLPGETDFSDVIQRILGKKWQKLFAISSFLLLFLAAMVYFLLLNQVLYGFTNFILFKAGYDNQVKIQEIVFDKYSVQYQAIILIVPIFALINMKELTSIIKLAKYGIIAIIAYFIFIIYFSQKWDIDMHYFTSNFGDIAGTFSLAFFIHNCITQITSNNEKQENNLRDVTGGYSIVFLIYGLVGVFGSIGIVGVAPYAIPVQTICQFFKKDDIPAAIVNLLFVFQLSTVLPVLAFICRTQFFQILEGVGVQIPDKNLFFFNCFFTASCGAFQIFCISPSLIIGLDGAVCGFLIVYIIPFFLCKRINGVDENDTIMQIISNESVLLVENQIAGAENHHLQRLTEYQYSDVNSNPNISVMKDNLESEQQLIESDNKGGNFNISQWAVWIFILGIGFIIGLLQILGIFKVTF